MPESGAAETILAADAVIAIRAIRTIFKVLGISAIIAMINVNALKTDFARIAVIAIHAIAGIQHDAAVETVFIKIRREEEVTVFIFIRMGAIVGIFRTDVDVVETGGFKAKLIELFKKGHEGIITRSSEQLFSFLLLPQHQQRTRNKNG